MRAWGMPLIGFGYSWLIGAAVAQFIKPDPNELVYVTYEKAYFYFTARDGTKKDMRKTSLVTVLPRVTDTWFNSRVANSG
jgi:hypothetical protein